MDCPFIERNFFAKIQGALEETRITIEKPIISASGLFECRVTFSNVKKYSAVSKGIDEFNAVESALDYVEAICTNSDDPEFFINENESMKGFNRDGSGIL